MKALKFLYMRAFSRRWIIVSGIVVFLAMNLAVMLFHEPYGEDDFLACKIMQNYGVLFFTALSSIFLNSDLVGGRCLRASAISEKLYKQAVPLYGIINVAGYTAVELLIYGLYIILTGQDMAHISDYLITAAILGSEIIILTSLTMCLRYGFIIIIYGGMIQYFAFAFINPDFSSFGFGMPLWLSAVICVGAYAVSSVISFIAAKLIYEKVNFRPVAAQNVAGK